MYFAANPSGTIPRAAIDVLAPQEFKITVPANTTSYSSGTLRNRYGAYDATHIDAGGFIGFLSTMSKNPYTRDNNSGSIIL